MKSILELLQTRGYTRHWQTRRPCSCRAGLFMMRCAQDTNTAGLKYDVDIRTVGVGGHYLPTTG